MAEQENTTREGSSASSPSKPGSSRSMPPPSQAAVGTSFQMRTEIPKTPFAGITAFAALDTDDKSAGNFNYTTELLEKGYVGFWRKRDQACYEPTAVELNVANYFEGIRNTLQGVLTRLFEMKTQLPDETVIDRVNSTADTLACGCCLMTYMKVRNLVTSELPARHSSSNLRRPRAKDALPLPSGFAFAIQQLGIVNAADTVNERIFVPCFPNTGHTNGIPDAQAAQWNPNAYARAVEYARTLGLHFSVVNLGQKDGSAWWLFRQTFSEDVFELECTLPEVNFTKAMVVTHAMFLNGNRANASRSFVNITPLGTDNYGIMMRNPHLGIHLSCYEAITQEAEPIVSNV